jgi:hypothetical protein
MRGRHEQLLRCQKLPSNERPLLAAQSGPSLNAQVRRVRCDVMADRSDREQGQPKRCPRHHSLINRMGPCLRTPIRASSLKRLHQQAGQKTAPDQCHCVNLALATREPSTEDIVRADRHVSKVPLAETNSGAISTNLAARGGCSRQTLPSLCVQRD